MKLCREEDKKTDNRMNFPWLIHKRNNRFLIRQTVSNRNDKFMKKKEANILQKKRQKNNSKERILFI